MTPQCQWHCEAFALENISAKSNCQNGLNSFHHASGATIYFLPQYLTLPSTPLTSIIIKLTTFLFRFFLYTYILTGNEGDIGTQHGSIGRGAHPQG